MRGANAAVRLCAVTDMRSFGVSSPLVRDQPATAFMSRLVSRFLVAVATRRYQVVGGGLASPLRRLLPVPAVIALWVAVRKTTVSRFSPLASNPDTTVGLKQRAARLRAAAIASVCRLNGITGTRPTASFFAPQIEVTSPPQRRPHTGVGQ